MIVESLDTEALLNCARSCMEYWVNTLRNDVKRKQLKEMAKSIITRTIREELDNGYML